MRLEIVVTLGDAGDGFAREGGFALELCEQVAFQFHVFDLLRG
jgi:hypothetical protein